MGNRFVIADTHFGHKKIVQFTNNNGKPIRPWPSVEEHDEALIENWNRVVNKKDTVYHLGDFSIPKSGLEAAKRLNGNITLIKGNHDPYRMREYVGAFFDIQGTLEKDNIILTHIPIHPDCIERWAGNIHGHLHTGSIDDPRYLCVSCEQINFTPLSWDQAVSRLQSQ